MAIFDSILNMWEETIDFSPQIVSFVCFADQYVGDLRLYTKQMTENNQFIVLDSQKFCFAGQYDGDLGFYTQ